MFFSCYFGFDRVSLYSPRWPRTPSAGSAGIDYRTVLPCQIFTFHVVSQTQKFHQVLLFTMELWYFSPQSGQPRFLNVPIAVYVPKFIPSPMDTAGLDCAGPSLGALHGEFWCFSLTVITPQLRGKLHTHHGDTQPPSGKAATSRLEGSDLVSDFGTRESWRAGAGCCGSTGRSPVWL